jgi:hypothetical protein
VLKERQRKPVATYRVITQSIDKSVYEVQADSESMARIKMDNYLRDGGPRDDIEDVDFIGDDDEEVIEVLKLRD